MASVTCLVLAAGGYAWADAADVVPGPLTARAPAAPPPPPAPEPVVQVPAGVLGAAGPAAVDGTVPGDGPAPADDLLPGASGAEPAPPVDAQALAAALAPLLADPALGPAPALSVRDLATGEEVVTRSASTLLEPASTLKLVTAAAALEVLGAEEQLLTRVSWVPAEQRPSGRPAVVLVGGGDLLLSAGTGDPAATDGRVGLLDLARTAVDALVAGEEQARLLRPGTAAVDVVVDDSLLGGAGPDPGAPGDAFYASPLSSLAVAAGRRGPGQGRDPAPAASAGQAFAAAVAQALAEDLGPAAPVTGPVEVSSVPVPAGPVLAEGRSAPVADVIAHVLVTSDNTVADAVAALVAQRSGAPTDVRSAGRAVVDVVRGGPGASGPSAGPGVDLGGTVAADGSGLDDGSLSSASALTGLLAAAAAAPPGSDLARLPALLPVAGLEGTLAERFTAAEGSARGRGVVRAKTGTLTGVVALAGVGTTAQGRGVAFAVLGGGVPAGGTDAARAAADRVAAAVAACC